jgi:class 3 adenylate cyclase
VNLANRIESVAGSGEILISEVTAELIGKTFLLSSSRVVDLKGKGPTKVYSIIGGRPEDSKQGLDPDKHQASSLTKQKTDIAALTLH